MNDALAIDNTTQTSGTCPWHESLWTQLLAQFQAGQMAHAYLVCGEQGIGKFALVHEFAKYFFCLTPANQNACGQCAMCKLARSGSQPDILIVEPEEGSKAIKVDQIRALSSFVARTSHSGKGKIIIINQAECLNISASNSLLKTLEEPSSNTYLFLVTSRADSLVATLRSRCQRLLLQTPSLTEATHWLQQHGIAPDQAHSLAIAAGRRPLYGLALASANGLADVNEFLRCLIAVCQQQIPIQNAVAVALKMGEQFAVEYLVQSSSIVIKALALGSQEDDALMAELIKCFALVEDKSSLLRRMLVFNSTTEQALRQLRSGTNPNAQLLLESLLWQWSRLARR